MIKELSILNWQCYRGTHKLPLGPHAYAVVASHVADPGRSNFSGKSALFEAIDFVCFGRLNPIRKHGAEGWITKGEKQGGISLTFEDGTVFSRERVRGHSTQIRVKTTEGRLLSQDDAAIFMIKYLHFDADDFKTVGFFESKQMSRIIRTDPKDRLDAVRGWLNLLPAEKAEDLASEWAKARVRELQRLKARREGILAMLQSHSTVATGSIEEWEAKRDEAQARIDKARKRLTKHQEAKGYQRIIKEYDELVEVGKRTASEVTKLPDVQALEHQEWELTEVLKEKSSLHHAAQKEVSSKKKVALGQFDGRCPVVDGFTCPAKKEINADRERSQVAYEEAKKAQSKAKEAEAEVLAQTEEVREKLHEAQSLQHRLESLREREEDSRDEYKSARKALKKIGDLPDVETLGNIIHKQQGIRENAIATIAEIKQSQAQKTKLEEELKRLDKDIEVEAERAANLIQVRSIFRATQRRIAERMLDRIGSRANQTLAEAGVGLKIDIKWEKEGKNLAKTCEMCGAPFATSTKVKACESCGAERGQHVIQRLDFDLSDRSDGADDFAGIAMQLAAGSYLLTNRESPWKTCLVDEPFSALDQTLRKSAAKQLLHLVGSSVYRQVFVISHSRDTVALYPHAIRISVDRNGQRSISVE